MKNKTKRLLVYSAALLGLHLSNVTYISEANELSNEIEIMNPLLNYISMYIPEEKLNEITPSGYSVADILIIALSEYEEGISPLYIDGVLIANKEFRLPKEFAGDDLANEAESKLSEMCAAAKLDGFNLTAFSKYRSYDRQAQLYSNYVARDGQEAADRYSAKPGASEHQTALAFDIGGLNSSKWASFTFHEEPEAQWLAKNASKYGFILRFPEEKEGITGYRYESWHFRYVGEELAQKIYELDTTLEEYFGLDKLKELKPYLHQA